MIALKLTILVIGVMTGGYYMQPMQIETMHAPMEYAKTQIEVVNKMILPVAPIVNKIEPVSINHDKTYEQCMKEAFERIYEEVNRRLAEGTDS